MNYDDPKLTAYALGEVAEGMELDDGAAKIVEETALIAGVLREHYRRPRRGRRVMRVAMAAVVVLVGFGIFVVPHRRVHRETVAVVPVEQPIVMVQRSATPILHLTPAWTEKAEASSLMSANFQGIRAMDVEQLVSVVIEDASRVGAFTSLRMTPESDVMFQ
jgi:hypothetical protein